MTQGVAAGPLVVGGVGGSATRAVAELIRRVGVDTGSDLNPAGDNLWVTLLLRRPEWFATEESSGAAGIASALEILEHAMTGRLEPSIGLTASLTAAARDLQRQGRPAAWTDERVRRLEASSASFRPSAVWGWKEPNSHIYLEHLHRHFGDRLFYVHVIRNGLDMARSANLYQLENWGWYFGIPDAPRDASAALDYWIRSNTRAIALGHDLLGDHFWLLDIDDLWQAPEPAIGRFLAFLGIDPPPALVAELAESCAPPATRGRWRQFGLDAFTASQLAGVSALGFPVPGDVGPDRP